ncbi:MAG: hypothetical protein U9P36_13685 [Thermodesulfobacteriota bacterium]|nr:hypothetical protein [Thermodesulfobacteriota bacterium]
MQKVLISLPDSLADRMRAVIPNRQRSKVLSNLLEKEIKKREEALYQCACDVEADEALNKEMAHWDATVEHGLEDETW